MQLQNVGPPQPKLPPLRQDLRIEPSATGANGEKNWIVVDPAQHKYLQIDANGYAILSNWNDGTSIGDFAAALARDHQCFISPEEIAVFATFCADNNLTVEPADGGWRALAAQADRGRHGWLMWLVHNYLFIKLPLIKPEPWLRPLSDWLSPIFSPRAAIAVGIIGLLAIYLVSRQWGAFWTTVQYSFSWSGAVWYAAALIVVKSAHELGHALTAIRYRCRVPTMGVCFLVMFPVLYTDVTDAWRLPDRKQRLAIGAAGMIVELSLACIAALLWTFLPDGALKSIAFSTATVGLLLTLTINLNPLMRFDGYYLFADWLGIDNLQSRAFAFGRWRMRQTLFGIQAPKPESLPHTTERALIVFAWVVWIYRLILFTGIALLVYHMAFKLLGIILFLIEIVYFIIRPIATELAHWWRERKQIAISKRGRWVVASAIALVAMLFVPWSTRVRIPAIVESGELAWVYPKRSAIISNVKVKSGDRVKAGDVLAVTTAPDLTQRLKLAEQHLALINLRLGRRGISDPARTDALVLEKERLARMSEIAGLKQEAAELTITAPVSGMIFELNPEFQNGRAISNKVMLGLIRGDGDLMARGYLPESDVALVKTGATGEFVPDVAGMSRLAVTLRQVADTGANSIEIAELASVYGGAIAVRPHAVTGGQRRLIPVSAQYPAILDVASAENPPPISVRGEVHLTGEPHSLAGQWLKKAAAILVRESGF